MAGAPRRAKQPSGISCCPGDPVTERSSAEAVRLPKAMPCLADAFDGRIGKRSAREPRRSGQSRNSSQPCLGRQLYGTTCAPNVSAQRQRPGVQAVFRLAVARIVRVHFSVPPDERRWFPTRCRPRAVWDHPFASDGTIRGSTSACPAADGPGCHQSVGPGVGFTTAQMWKDQVKLA